MKRSRKVNNAVYAQKRKKREADFKIAVRAAKEGNLEVLQQVREQGWPWDDTFANEPGWPWEDIFAREPGWPRDYLICFEAASRTPRGVAMGSQTWMSVGREYLLYSRHERRPRDVKVVAQKWVSAERTPRGAARTQEAVEDVDVRLCGRKWTS